MENADLTAMRDGGSKGGRRWFVVQTLARREFGAALRLEAQAFATFCPHVLRSVRHARRMRTVKTAFFPGYVFVSLDLARDRWRSVNGTIGVLRLVSRPDGAPLPAPRGIVERLMDYRDADGVCRFDRDLAVGAQVRVIAGPLADLVGELVRRDPGDRARVLLRMLGGEVGVDLGAAALETA